VVHFAQPVPQFTPVAGGVAHVLAAVIYLSLSHSKQIASSAEHLLQPDIVQDDPLCAEHEPSYTLKPEAHLTQTSKWPVMQVSQFVLPVQVAVVAMQVPSEYLTSFAPQAFSAATEKTR